MTDLASPASAPATAGDINPDRGHLPTLDGVRGMAVLMVMFFHFFQREDFKSGLGHAITTVANIGQTGVNLFFVLSGFLITGILLHEKSSANYFWNFYGRRILRISPLYYFALAMFYFVLCPLTGSGVPPLLHQLWGWFYLINVQETFTVVRYPQAGHFWSLAVEEHFYLFWPALVWVTGRRGLYMAGAACLVISMLSRFILFKLGYGGFFFTFCQLDAIACGSMLALFVRGPGGFSRLHRIRPKLCLAVSTGMMIPLWFCFKGAGSEFNQVVKALLLAVVFAALVASVISPGTSMLHRIFGSRTLRWFGKYSYGLYVWDSMIHMTPRHWYSKENVGLYIHNPALLIVTCMVLQFPISIAVAYASWHLFEKRFLRFKKYFTYDKTAAV